MNEEKKKSTLPATALWLEFASALCLLFGYGIFYTIIFWYVGVLLFLVGIIMPFIAIIQAICALCLGKRKIGTSGVVYSVLAIIIPIIAALIIIMLFRTGVAYIRFM